MSINTNPAGIQMYPCARGMGGMGVGYHEFVNSNGAVICRYCGARPPAEPLRVTCVTTPASSPQGIVAGGFVTDGRAGQRFETVHHA